MAKRDTLIVTLQRISVKNNLTILGNGATCDAGSDDKFFVVGFGFSSKLAAAFTLESGGA